jgi:hypothetical protein
MNCEDFENNVNDLAREQALDVDVRARALAHRDECAACAKRLADESALSFKLRVLAADLEAGEVPVLSDKVLAALREQQAPLIVQTPAAHSRFGVWAVATTATAAVAALILIAVAVAFMRARPAPSTASSPSNPGTQNEPGQRNVEKDHQLLAGVQLIDKPVQKLGGGAGTRHNKRALNRAGVSAAPAARVAHKDVAEPSVTVSYSPEVATDFFPVGYGSAPNLGDGGQLVRVELSRSALIAFGVPMNVNRYNEKVKAEVLFGMDGMAHAIRFVQ